ncbi:MAG: putative transport system permease protein, partial [Cyanobacteriota bacterium erpe_2018_sw_39hr_WHONDRS-SW48-000098_B_bin.30]|nr:putative transport system permease protein [Cyanobacteriota bacterium erpe_2018_sw_39hr_WHONDRS-SW48-000098_B_bin.30]
MMDSFTFALRLFERFVLRDIRRNLLRTVLTICGITLGVAVFLAISIANDTALARFRQTVGQVAGKANLELIPLSGASIDESAMRDLQVLSREGVKWTPLIDEHIVIDTSGAARSADKTEPEPSASTFESKDREIVQLIGLDMLADPDFKSYQSSDESQSVDTAVQG